MTREQFIELAGGLESAVEFETQALSIGRSLLPKCAQEVLDGGEDSEEYWQWLASQLAC